MKKDAELPGLVYKQKRNYSCNKEEELFWFCCYLVLHDGNFQTRKRRRTKNLAFEQRAQNIITVNWFGVVDTTFADCHLTRLHVQPHKKSTVKCPSLPFQKTDRIIAHCVQHKALNCRFVILRLLRSKSISYVSRKLTYWVACIRFEMNDWQIKNSRSYSFAVPRYLDFFKIIFVVLHKGAFCESIIPCYSTTYGEILLCGS